MSDSGPYNPLSYRQEVAARFFNDYVRGRESCIVVGIPGGGMTRLVDFLVRPDVQAHYLNGMDRLPLLLKVDCNRTFDLTDWGLCEVMLTVLVEGCSLRPETVSLRQELGSMRSEVITNRNPLLALRNLELAVHILIEQTRMPLYFVFSGFDELFRDLPDLALNHLRALRDAHKYDLEFALCLHQLPDLIKPGRRDKLSARILQNILMAGHYSAQDARVMIEQLSARRGVSLSPVAVSQIIRLSGRHAGLVQGIFNSLPGLEQELPDEKMVSCLLDQPPALIECQRVWDRLSEMERKGLKEVTQNFPPAPTVQQLLERKSLIQQHGRELVVFSPLFAQFISCLESSHQLSLSVDPVTHTVRIGSRVIPKVSRLVFKLLDYLYEHVGEVCSRDKIIEAIYTSREGVSDEAVVSLVKQARALIEPDDGSYQFLLTVRGTGYKLMDVPQYREPEHE